MALATRAHDDFRRVVGLVTASLVVGLVLNLVYVLADPPWAKRLGDSVSTAIACGVLVVLLLVFPFDFGGWSDWETPFRVVVGLACLGTAVAVVVDLVEAVRSGLRRVVAPDRTSAPGPGAGGPLSRQAGE